MKTKVWIALLAIYIVWGSTYLGIRFAVETIPPFLSAGIRFLVSGLILFTWRRLSGDPAPTPNQWKSALIVGLLLLLGGNGILSWAEKSVPSGIAALLVGTIPLFLVLVEALRPGGVKPGWQQILGLLIGFGGIALLIGPAEFFGATREFYLPGLLACLVAAFLWSLGSIYNRGADLPKSTLLFTGMEMLMGSIGLLVASFALGEWTGFNPGGVSIQSMLGLIYLIAFGSLIGFVSYGWLLRNAPISLVATYAYVNPIVAILLGSWLASESLNARILIASAIIISSVVLINTSKKAEAIQKEEVTSSGA
jgi:drug/metabolite transporter (DMT)-like permease